MSSRLVRKQLSSLQQDRQEPEKDSKGVKKRRAKQRKQQLKELEKKAAEKDVYHKNLEYLLASKSAQQEALDVMAKLLGQQPKSQAREDEEDLDFDF